MPIRQSDVLPTAVATAENGRDGLTAVTAVTALTVGRP